MKIQHILVPVDFSECSVHVAREAAELASQLHARVTLLYAAEIPGGIDEEAIIHPRPGEPGIPVMEFYRRKATEELQPFRELLKEHLVEHLIWSGKPADTILRACDELEIDLVMMGTNARTGLRRLLLGSVTEEVIRHASVPVLTVSWAQRS